MMGGAGWEVEVLESSKNSFFEQKETKRTKKVFFRQNEQN
jgi:hypothetical protein